MDSLLSSKKKAAVPNTPRTPSRASRPRPDDDEPVGDDDDLHHTTPARNRSRSEPKYPFTPLRTPKRANGGSSGGDEFKYDRVFGPDAQQEAVFDEVEPQIASIVDGFNATVFVYGQTGAGKTHTMMGGDGAAGTERGIALRAIDTVFRAIEERQDSLFVVRVSFVELYNDQFRDLLDPDNQPTQVAAAATADEPAKKPMITIRETARGDVFLEGSETLNTRVKSANDAFRLIRAGTKARHVAQTQLNGASSRSHAILTIVVESSSSGGRVVQRGTLNLVDLAGSERLKKSMAEGAVARETAKINQSLSALGDVLSALSSDNYTGRVPYRNSKLTRLLSSTLGGNSQTFFIIHLHTTALHYHESLMSCMYGARAKRIKNMVEATIDTSSSGDMRRLQAEIDQLKAKMHSSEVELQRLRQTKTSSEKQAADVQQKLALMVEITAQEKKRLEEKMDEIIHMANATKAEAKWERQTLEAECVLLRNAKNSLELRLVNAQDERDQFREAVASLNTELASALAERDAARSQLDDMQARIDRLEAQLHKPAKQQPAAIAVKKEAPAKMKVEDVEPPRAVATKRKSVEVPAQKAAAADDEADDDADDEPIVAAKPRAAKPIVEHESDVEDEDEQEPVVVKPVKRPAVYTKKAAPLPQAKRARATADAPQSPAPAPVDKENSGTPLREKHGGAPLGVVNKAPRLSSSVAGASKFAVPMVVKQAAPLSKPITPADTPVKAAKASTPIKAATPVKLPTPVKAATPAKPVVDERVAADADSADEPAAAVEKPAVQRAKLAPVFKKPVAKADASPPAAFKKPATPESPSPRPAKKSGNNGGKRKMFNPSAFMISPAVAPVAKKKSSGLALAGAPSLRDFLQPPKLKGM